MLLDKPFALRVVSSVESSESSDATIEGTDLWKVLWTRREWWFRFLRNSTKMVNKSMEAAKNCADVRLIRRMWSWVRM